MTHPLPAELRARKPLCRLSQRAADRIEELERRVAELEGALAPFAAFSPALNPKQSGPFYAAERSETGPREITYEDFRRAWTVAERSAPAHPTDEPSTPFVYDKAPGEVK